MPAPARACILFAITSIASLAACSNGRGSLDQSEEPPPAPAQESFTVGGSVSGLTGSGLVLRNNDGSDLAVSGDGPFTFSSALANAATYRVAVATQPANPSQTCAVTNGSGTIAGANVTNVEVTCSTAAAPTSFFVRGGVTGLAGSGLVLRNNGIDDLAISADGEFSFPTAIASGGAYNVTVLTHPTNPSQSCTIAHGSGIMGTADVTDVAVTCTTGRFTVGGTASGLSGTGAAGSGVTLQNNGGDDLTLTDNSAFEFVGRLASGGTYNVTVSAHPTNPVQTCVVENPAGTVRDRSVTNVRVKCATNVYTVGGTVTGLAGTGLSVEINGDRRPITSNGVYAFEQGLRSGTPYFVRVREQPSNPAQTCEVANSAGVVTNGNVTNVDITCTTRSFTVGGTVSGLQGAGLTLANNGTDELAIASDGNFTFQGELLSGTAYHVNVRRDPSNPLQICSVENGSGIVGSGNVRNIRVNCSTRSYAVGGTVNGLLGSRVVLLNNGGDPLTVSANGPFTFRNEVTSGAAYAVTVQTQPENPTQTCTVQNGSGRVDAAAVADIVVSCTTSEFTVGGSVSGLVGTNLVLRNNGTDDLRRDAGGSFTFNTPLPSGATYDVTVATQPSGPDQACSVANGSGTVGSGNVTSVAVTCASPQEYTIGGQVSGLTGSGLMLQNNGADDLGIGANGPFTFQTSHTAGTPYNVTVATQPSGQTCSVENGAGTVSGSNVANVQVTCVNNL